MAGFSALGTILVFSTTLSGYAATSSGYVVGLTNISGPTMSAEEIDVSSHDSTGAYREYVTGFLDAGEFSIEGNITGTTGVTSSKNVAEFMAGFNSRLAHNCIVIFPGTDRLSWKFHGYITGVETNAPYDDKASFSATIRVSGGTTGTPVLSTSTSTGA